MKWGGWTNALRRWYIVGFLLGLTGVVMTFVGGRPWDGPGLGVAVLGAVVLVAGYYRHPPTQD